MKRTSIFLFLQLLISIFLTSESFAFPTFEEVTKSSFQDGNSSIQVPINHQALFVEEVGTVKTFEQNFYPKINFFSENNSRYKKLITVCLLSESKGHFLFKKNLKRLLTQQIFPYHLFW